MAAAAGSSDEGASRAGLESRWPGRGGLAIETAWGEVCLGRGVCGAPSHFLSIASDFSLQTVAWGGGTLRSVRPSHERPQKKGWTRSVSPLD
eukprot:3628018-Prymnesium_polylepis.1